jgi:hypothetical protein
LNGAIHGTDLEELHLAGDNASPRRIADAGYDGDRVGQKI